MYFLRKLSYIKGYKCYSLEIDKYYTSMDMTFFENQPFFTKNLSQEEKVSEDIIFWMPLLLYLHRHLSLDNHKHYYLSLDNHKHYYLSLDNYKHYYLSLNNHKHPLSNLLWPWTKVQWQDKTCNSNLSSHLFIQDEIILKKWNTLHTSWETMNLNQH